MPKATFAPKSKTFRIFQNFEKKPLSGLSIDDPIIVTFRTPTRQIKQERQERRNDETEHTIVWNEESKRNQQKLEYPTFSKGQAIDLWLSLSECNITDEDDKPLFTFVERKSGEIRVIDSFDDFEKKLNKLDPEWVDEMHDRCLFLNSDWGDSAYTEEDEIVLDIKQKK